MLDLDRILDNRILGKLDEVLVDGNLCPSQIRDTQHSVHQLAIDDLSGHRRHSRSMEEHVGIGKPSTATCGVRFAGF